VLVEALVVIAMTAFDFAIVTGRPWSDELMDDAELLTKHIQRMLFFSRLARCTCVLEAIVGLDDFGQTPIEGEGLHQAVDGIVGGDVVIPLHKPFAVGFIDDGVLIELLVIRSLRGLAYFRDILRVHLPFFTDGDRSIVWLRRVLNKCFLPITEVLDQDTI